MTKRDRMYKAIEKHGESLLELFPQATVTEPIKICKSLMRVETEVSRPILTDCNIGIPEEEIEAAKNKALSKVRKILGITEAMANEIGIFINTDPRGYALKINDNFIRRYNEHAEKRIFTDWGGYGILAPDFRE